MKNYDQEIEKRHHPENFEEADFEEAHDLIDIIEDAIAELSYWSTRNDDLFNGEIDRMLEEIKNCRKQI